MERIEYPGLVVVTTAGAPWRWAGSRMVMSKRRGYEVRCELFERKCARPDCEQRVVVAQKLPALAVRKYTQARERFVNRPMPSYMHPGHSYPVNVGAAADRR